MPDESRGSAPDKGNSGASRAEGPQGQRLTGGVPGPHEFKEGFEGVQPSNFQPLFPGQPKPQVMPQGPVQASPPPAETQQGGSQNLEE